ncbi:flagellar basal body P-ring protein FlgI [Moellerella wisconsensis]|uniref:Flagellar basal body P-ring protein FlgI n=1 Tax=Moellerella wisconsensis TaxID=158849 RepID=A0ACD3YAQ2_9GAMM|nr:flagellar basal body P-ring protein FlgI [Moellerella wisconsensis]UNH25220.1 flagellar basal body P-ring protein FlgI [Moellerella wisconsensis]UNH39888.1 flagellar basal body P-ring protein FlgI [Moellerella wisconsensis]WJW82830.1 flagellar basal body P-ring protein FlgI [Moellerella wisconsensis]
MRSFAILSTRNGVVSYLRLLLCSVLFFVPLNLHAERIRDLTSLQGIRDNALIGYGLVVGLDGTGDQTMQTPFTTQSMSNMLSQLGITVPTGTNMQLKNVAAVMITAKLPPFGRTGQTVDIVVSSLGNAKSLRGGTLLMTPLKGADNQVYAMAQGNIIVGGIGAESGKNSVKINQLAGGRISNGAVIEREVAMSVTDKEFLNLQLNEDNFTQAQNITDSINRLKGHGIATALDARTIKLQLPLRDSDRVRFIAQIQDIKVPTAIQDAKVILNARTGAVVMNQHVTLESCAIAQGNLSVTVDSQIEVSQPTAPLAGGSTVVSRNTDINISEPNNRLQKVNTSADLNKVVSALNTLGATPADLMSILQAMESAGCLNAKLEII